MFYLRFAFLPPTNKARYIKNRWKQSGYKNQNSSAEPERFAVMQRIKPLQKKHPRRHCSPDRVPALSCRYIDQAITFVSGGYD